MSSRSRFFRRLVLAAVIVAAAVGVFAAVSSLAARSARQEIQRRPIVLLLHGRGQLGRDTSRIRAEWQDALEAGMWTLTRRPLIGPGDVRLVWYADVLDPASSTGACESGQRPGQRSGRTHQDDGDVLQLLLGFTGALFTSLYESMPAESRQSMRALVGDVLYLGDRWRRCAVDHRLESALAQVARDGRPVILVAHSFGSLVAYSYLRGERPRGQTAAPVIHRFVTLGSMLGIPELQELLLGRSGPLSLPAGVRSWVNVRHLRDPFAASLADTAGRQTSAMVREVVTSGNAADPHDILAYLRDPAAARALERVAPGPADGPRPPGCGEIRRDVP